MIIWNQVNKFSSQLNTRYSVDSGCWCCFSGDDLVVWATTVRIEFVTRRRPVTRRFWAKLLATSERIMSLTIRPDDDTNLVVVNTKILINIIRAPLCSSSSSPPGLTSLLFSLMTLLLLLLLSLLLFFVFALLLNTHRAVCSLPAQNADWESSAQLRITFQCCRVGEKTYFGSRAAMRFAHIHTFTRHSLSFYLPHGTVYIYWTRQNAQVQLEIFLERGS